MCRYRTAPVEYTKLETKIEVAAKRRNYKSRTDSKESSSTRK